MTHEYHATWIDHVRTAMGDAVEYAVHRCNIPGQAFLDMFAAGSVSVRLEHGEPSYVAGRSGIEIAREVIAEATGQEPTAEPHAQYGRSTAYWIGWASAGYQILSGFTYKEIYGVLTYEQLEQMYPTFHEADFTRFVDIVDRRMQEHYTQTNLKRIRTAYGCTQAWLAEHSGVSLRSIQMYEQRGKDINKAGADTLYRMARVLGCAMEDLLEAERIMRIDE